MRIKSIKVTVSRTVQVDRFEPVQVTIEEAADLEPGDDIETCEFELYKQVTKRVKKCIDNEVAKYAKSKKDD